MNVFYFTRDGRSDALGKVKKVDNKGRLKQVEEFVIDVDMVGSIYDYTQYSGTVKPGDIMYIEDDDGSVIVAVLYGAWPTQLSGKKHPALHSLQFDKRYV